MVNVAELCVSHWSSQFSTLFYVHYFNIFAFCECVSPLTSSPSSISISLSLCWCTMLCKYTDMLHYALSKIVIEISLFFVKVEFIYLYGAEEENRLNYGMEINLPLFIAVLLFYLKNLL